MLCILEGAKRAFRKQFNDNFNRKLLIVLFIYTFEFQIEILLYANAIMLWFSDESNFLCI